MQALLIMPNGFTRMDNINHPFPVINVPADTQLPRFCTDKEPPKRYVPDWWIFTLEGRDRDMYIYKFKCAK